MNYRDHKRRIAQSNGTQDELINEYALRKRAILHGFSHSSDRTKAWMQLLGCEKICRTDQATTECYNFKDMEVYKHDIDRLFAARRHNHDRFSKNDRVAVDKIIGNTLTAHTEMKYFQGLHDIAFICAKICGYKNGIAVFQALCLYWIRPFLSNDLKPVEDICSLIYKIVSRRSQKIANILKITGHERGFYALSWIMTLFTHEFSNDVCDAARILDFLFATHPIIFTAYIAAALVLDHASSIEKIFSNQGDHAAMHTFLSRLPQMRTQSRSGLMQTLLLRVFAQDTPQQDTFGDALPSIDKIFDLYGKCLPVDVVHLDRQLFFPVYQQKSTPPRKRRHAYPSALSSHAEFHPRIRLLLSFAKTIPSSKKDAPCLSFLYLVYIICGLITVWNLYRFIFLRSPCIAHTMKKIAP